MSFDYVGRIIAGFVAVVMAILFPLQYLAQLNSENLDYHLDSCTKELTESIKENGYLDKSMYEEYIDTLDKSGELYDVDIEDIHPVTGDEVTEADEGHGFSAASVNPKTSVLGTELPLDLSAMNSINNTKLFSLASTAHTHTDDCYAGHRHANSCVALGKQTSLKVTFYRLTQYHLDAYQVSITCANCGKTLASISLGDNTVDNGETKYNGLETSAGLTLDNLYTSYYYYDTTTGTVKLHSFKLERHYPTTITNWSDYTTPIENLLSYILNVLAGYYPYYYCAQSGLQYSGTISNFTFSSPINQLYIGYCPYCGLASSNFTYSCGQVQDETPICNQVVTSITAAYPEQTIKQGESIDATATATYLDGHTGTVTCSVSGFNANSIGTQTATLTYSGLVDNAKTTGTKTCTVNVTVANPKMLTSLSVSPANQVINRYGTPTFTVTASYSDGSSVNLSNTQYSMSPFDSSGTGPHTITFSYSDNGITQTASATVCVDALVSILVTPNTLTVERYTDPSALPFTITATYMYSNNRTITSGYNINDYSPLTIGEQNVTISYAENGITAITNAKVQVTLLHQICSQCGTTYELNADDIDPGCPVCKHLITGITVTLEELEINQGESLPIIVTATYADGSSADVFGWSSNFDTNKFGLQVVTVEYEGFASDITVWVNEAMITCPVCGQEYPASDDRCPYCAARIVSITVTPNDVTVYQYDSLDLTVEAFHADESSEYVTEWSIDHDTSAAGTFEAIVTYKDVTAKITLTVISETAVICPICSLSYEPSDNPKGCPVCSVLLTGIEAYLTSGSNLVQLGTMPDITVILIFRDTHRELTTEGFILKNYDSTKLGTQTVTVTYQDFHTDIDLEVVNTLETKACPNGHVYYLNEDGSDPGCPYCNMSDGLETVYYFDITYIDEILDVIYTDGTYCFDKGNFITVQVTKKDVSLLTKAQNMFFKTALLGRKKRFLYGGEVTVDG